MYIIYECILTKYMSWVRVFFFFLLVTGTFKRLTVFRDFKKYAFSRVLFALSSSKVYFPGTVLIVFVRIRFKSRTIL